jgi:hypothetical protein
MHGAVGGCKSGEKDPNYRHGVRAKAMSKVRALIRKLSGPTAWGDI